MDAHRLSPGHLLAALGALGALVSLWRPWYAIDLGSVLDRIAPKVDLVTGGASATITATGWQILRGADVALCVGAVAVLALVGGASGVLEPAVRVDAQRRPVSSPASGSPASS